MTPIKKYKTQNTRKHSQNSVLDALPKKNTYFLNKSVKTNGIVTLGNYILKQNYHHFCHYQSRIYCETQIGNLLTEPLECVEGSI